MQHVEQLVDSSLGPLLREDCDDTAFVKGVLDTQGTVACLEALSSGSQVLGAELGDQVSVRYEQLLSEVHAVQALEAKLLRNNERVDSLMQAVRRIRAQCSEPYASMQSKVTQLDQMQQCADILRSVQRLLYQCRKLRESAAALGDGAASGKPAPGHAAGGALVTDLPRVALSIPNPNPKPKPKPNHNPNPNPQRQRQPSPGGALDPRGRGDIGRGGPERHLPRGRADALPAADGRQAARAGARAAVDQP